VALTADTSCALVVEDELDLREAIADLLELEGYRVATAANGREALDQLAAKTPGIVLLDLMMPVVDGWQVLDAMRRDERLRGVPVVVISAHPHPPADVPVLPKPFHGDDLLATMRESLGDGAPRG
jgi:CheY-like chemotaxis protein